MKYSCAALQWLMCSGGGAEDREVQPRKSLVCLLECLLWKPEISEQLSFYTLSHTHFPLLPACWWVYTVNGYTPIINLSENLESPFRFNTFHGLLYYYTLPQMWAIDYKWDLSICTHCKSFNICLSSPFDSVPFNYLTLALIQPEYCSVCLRSKRLQTKHLL